MSKIKFGTDGWRAIIAKEYTVTNLERVAIATAEWVIKNNNGTPRIVIGHDCRFGGEMFLQAAAAIFADKGIEVIAAKGFVSTPMVSLATKEFDAQIGVVITASHNPPSYNGFKLKAHFGGPASPAVIEEVEDLIPAATPSKLDQYEALVEAGKIEYKDLEGIYCDMIEKSFDMDAIRTLKFGYDAMYGAGQNVVKRLFPDAFKLHCDHNPSFRGQAPEPIHKNLLEFSQALKNNSELQVGFANDGDADRIGMYDGDGEFVDSHHIILLLIHYLCNYKKLSGKIVVAFSVTEKIVKLCKHYGLDLEVTKIGFKYIAEKMTVEDVLVGGEESGGIAVGTFIPERDGIFIALTIMEFMAKTGKSINDLIQEVYNIIGSFSYSRDDLHITEELKQSIIQNCKDGKYQVFGDYPVKHVKTIDGFKFFISDDEWIMIRPSGTEPVLRVYCEAENATKVRTILDQVAETIL